MDEFSMTQEEMNDEVVWMDDADSSDMNEMGGISAVACGALKSSWRRSARTAASSAPASR